MACVTKRRGAWVVDYRLYGVRKTPSFRTKAEAESFYKALLLRDLDNQIGHKKIESKSIDEAIDLYLQTITPKKEPLTQLADHHALKQFKAEFTGFNIQSIQLQQLEKYQMSLLKLKLKASSVNRKFNVIRHFFRKCFEWRFCAENPTLLLAKLKEETVIRNPLSTEQMDKIINALPTWAARAFYFAAKTGVRRGGICQLTWDCVNFESKSIKIFSKKGGVTKEINLPMTFDTHSLLLELWNEKIKSGYNLDFVFLNENGRKILPCTLTKKLASVRDSTGIENAGLHIVRHTILTDLSSSNQSGSVIQKVAGHASLTTSQKYVHHKNSDVRQALEKLEREKPLKIPLKIVIGGS